MEETIQQNLFQMGIRVRRDWVAECVAFCQRESQLNAASSRTRISLSDKVVEQFLMSDLNLIGEGSIPADASSMHNQVLDIKVVVQVDELSNVTERKESRDNRPVKFTKDHTPIMKLMITDGKSRFSAIEFQTINGLWTSLPGVKILIRQPMVWRGAFLLSPQNTEILGGQVQSLVDLHYGRISSTRNDPSLEDEDEDESHTRPFRRIKEIIDSRVSSRSQLRIKATIRSITQTLSWQDKFKMKVDVDDGSGKLELNVASEFIEKTIGITPIAFGRLCDTKQIEAHVKKIGNVMKNHEGIISIGYSAESRGYTLYDLDEFTSRDARAYYDYIVGRYSQLRAPQATV